MPGGREVELKLRIAPDDLEKLKRSPALRAMAQGRPVAKRLRSVYYDTPKLELWRERMTVRLRGLGRRRLQTVKLADGAAAAGVLDRAEWERQVSGDRPELAGLPDPAARRLSADPSLPGRLQPALETEFRRTAYLLRAPDGGEVELALDLGEVRGPGFALPVCEAELELKRGRPAQLYDVARALAAAAPVRVETRSKAQRGFAALAGMTDEAIKAEPVELDASADVETAFAAIVRACLAHFLANQAAGIDAQSPEGVHQMRVALRRLRSALGLYGDLVASPETEAASEAVRRLTRALAPPRDADVFVDELLAPVIARHADARLARFGAAAEALRRRRRDELRAEMDRAETGLSVLRLCGWAAGARWRRPGDAAQAGALARPIAELAPELLDARRRKVRKLGERIETLDEGERHELRIRCKKLRYASEFLQSLYPGQNAEAYVAGLVELQDSLGFLNDVATARKLVAAIVEGEADPARRAELEWAGGFVVGWREHAARRAWKKVQTRWRSFERRAKFWR